MTEPRHAAPDEEQPQVVVNDRRRIDPETGEVRAPAAPAEEGAAPDSEENNVVTGEFVDDAAVELKAQLDERTADLQRITAEYANYRKRVERDREAVINNAKASVASELLSVLDDVERAAAHGDLTGAFKAVADKLVSTLAKTGLEPFAHEGEAFDPSVHEAVQHSTSPDVEGPTVTAVLRRGYRFGEKLVRPALVAVTDHEPAAPAPESAPAEEN